MTENTVGWPGFRKPNCDTEIRFSVTFFLIGRPAVHLYIPLHSFFIQKCFLWAGEMVQQLRYLWLSLNTRVQSWDPSWWKERTDLCKSSLTSMFVLWNAIPPIHKYVRKMLFHFFFAVSMQNHGFNNGISILYILYIHLLVVVYIYPTVSSCHPLPLVLPLLSRALLLFMNLLWSGPHVREHSICLSSPRWPSQIAPPPIFSLRLLWVCTCVWKYSVNS